MMAKTEEAKKFYSSSAWHKCRKAYIAQRVAIDGGMCEVCHERPGKIVHHKIWLNEHNINNPDIALNFDNLRFECQECHNLEDDGSGGKLKMPRLRFDADGNPYEIKSGK